MAARVVVLTLASCFFCFEAARTSSALDINPIRRVVNMLNSMTKKIEAEGAKEQELFDKFMCYCKNGRGSLETSIAAAEDKIPQVQSSIKEIGAAVEQMVADVEAAKTGRSDAKTAMADAKALRTKEAAAFAKESSDFKTNIAAITKAVTALEKGAGGSFFTNLYGVSSPDAQRYR